MNVEPIEWSSWQYVGNTGQNHIVTRRTGKPTELECGKPISPHVGLYAPDTRRHSNCTPCKKRYQTRVTAA
jgi:hypothetical protein